MPTILLCDNGSTIAEATLQLRALSQALSTKTKHPVNPVSLQHADRIPIAKLNNTAAHTFTNFMHEQLTRGEREFIMLPLLFGNSKAITTYVPEEIKHLKRQHGEFSFTMADVIYPLPQGEALLSDIIYEHILQSTKSPQLSQENIVLVDHGSPNPQVTDVRKHLASTVQTKLANTCLLEQAVMERREGKEYDFNGDLLETWLKQKAQSGETSAVVILLFFLAGRHAGKDGDIVDICSSVMKEYPELKITISPLISEHPKFLSILQSRLNDAIKYF